VTGTRGTRALFLGTGNFLTPGRRYWNSFVLDGRILVEPSPIALPHLRRAGIDPGAIDVIVLSHFHADHTFGWPFLAVELLRSHRATPLHVVGPPGVRSHLADMLDLAGLPDIAGALEARVDVRFVDVTADGSWQEAGPLRFRAVEVDHVPHLDCFGYLFDLGGAGGRERRRIVGYSGDSAPCDGLEELAAHADVLVLECNGPHPAGLPKSHHDLADAEALRARHPRLPLVLTHLGHEPDLGRLPDTRVPNDFDEVVL
jgi:ribonuclease BN (tRNA processing enzyme)